ncbi:cell division cycle-associated protein 7 [Amia ocellicauda]|uniref:cell division cycle-associated protein 7 n=1 Tax=Amia ocellicauda TaxID=2972642 RepID=UPI003464E20D
MQSQARLGIASLSMELADLFSDDSGNDNDKTFYGFADSDLDNECSDSVVESSPGSRPDQFTHQCFTLKVVLRPRAPHQSEEEEEEEQKRGESGPSILAAPKSSSDSEEESRRNFMEKRALNVKANKAMLAQLMADLTKMPGSYLKPQKPIERGSGTKPKRAPRSAMVGEGAVRRNPERASRRQTRSMGVVSRSPSPGDDQQLQQSLEDELMEVRGPPRQRRPPPRPSMVQPHTIRPVEEITREELELVAENSTQKTYSSASGSTCHQCRQKTIDTKTCCRSLECRGVQGQFCGPCLRNRYGEEVRDALLNPEWTCPPCRGICNCSFCRQRDGRCPTGILFPLAQYHGFKDVHSYLSSLRNKLKAEDQEDV